MPEGIRTIVFLVCALVVTVIAFISYPRQESFQAPDRVGKSLFEEFTNPEDAAELKIVRFTEGVGEWADFEVARSTATGLWTIPSSSNYPADAETQMRDAAIALIDLQVLGVASDQSSDHEVYGVVEPDKETLEASQQGVGLLVGVKDAKGKDLAKLIIGKGVKSSEEQRFVRIPGQNLVYVVKIDPEKFPTEFEKWIEQDLLKLNSYDVQYVKLRDYSILTVKNPLTGQTLLDKFERRFEADVDWNSSDYKWDLGQLAVWRNSQRQPTTLLDTEELNKEKLDDLKTAIGDLKIVDVRRKPKGLGADLKAGDDIMNNNDSLASLMNRGFFPISEEGGEPELRAANGEVLVGVKDGVEYNLQFGKIESIEEDSEEGKLNRYLFVTTRLDQSAFPPLELEQLPADDAKPETTKPEDAKPEKTKPENAKPEPKEGEEKGAEEESVEKKSELELERERITKENQRKIDERDEALKKANKKIAELNARFADWYYVISEDEYKRIHLTRNDLIKEKESAKEEGFGVDALRKLEEDGLEEKKEEESTPPSTTGPPFGPGPGG